MISRFTQVAIASLSLAMCVACEASTPPPPTATAEPRNIGTITQSATECSLDLVGGALSVGSAVITAVSETDDDLLFHMWRLFGDYTFEEFQAHIAEDRRLAEAGEPGLGPPSGLVDLNELTAPAHSSSDVTVRFRDPGTYAIVCFDPQLNNRPLTLLGPFEVDE